MSCKIIDDPREARPYAWRKAPGVAAAYAGNAAPAGTEESPELQRRLSDLERRREAELAEVREAAFREGKNKGREEAHAELAPVIQNFSATVAALASLRGKVRGE